MTTIQTTVIIYSIIANIAGVSVMYSDKRRAVRHQWRIPEKTLFLVSIFGGGIGTFLGMRLFRHKTRHWYFVIGMPLIMAVQTAALICYFVW